MQNKLTFLARKALDISILDIARYVGEGKFPNTGKQISPDQKNLLEEMRHSVYNSPTPFKPSIHWKKVNNIFDKYFNTVGINNPEDQEYNLRFSGFAPRDKRLHQYVCWMYLHLIKKRDSLHLLDTLSATCSEGIGHGYHMDNKYVSLDLLLSIDEFYSMYELNPAIATSRCTIAELGAGWGRLGYVLSKVNPLCTYIIFDLPEALLVSQSYLPKLLPQAKVADYRSTRKLEKINKDMLLESNLWFLPPQDMPKFEPSTVDFVVTIASLQEMPQEYVTAYLNYFSKFASNGHCYIKQLSDGVRSGHLMDEIKNLESYHFPKEWEQIYLRDSLISESFFEAGFHIN